MKSVVKTIGLALLLSLAAMAGMAALLANLAKADTLSSASAYYSTRAVAGALNPPADPVLAGHAGIISYNKGYREVSFIIYTQGNA